MVDDLGDTEALLASVDKLYDLTILRPPDGLTTDDVVRERMKRDMEVIARIAQAKAIADRIRRT